MRLISNYKDYYDHYARNRNVSDMNYIWNRKTEEVSVDFAIPRPLQLEVNVLSKFKSSFEPFAKVLVVWFCGRAIPIIERHERRTNGYFGSWEVSYVNELGLLPDRLQRDWQEISKSKYDNFYKDALKIMDLANEPWMSVDFKPILLEGKVRPVKLEVVEMHRKLGTPVFCSYLQNIWEDKPKVVVNPDLSKLEFHKFVDSYSAFQELEQFVSNQMAPIDSRMDQPVPDKINAESHGFDKFSFRKEPSKGKK